MIAMQTDGDRLLADICDHPEDNVLRLVYADWLEENGGERGEVIGRAILDHFPEAPVTSRVSPDL